MAKKKAKTTQKKGVEKKNKVKKEDKSFTYVRIENSLPTRKSILETAIDSAEILKSWENYTKIKDKKMRAFEKLNTLINKIEREVTSLKRHIPKTDYFNSLEEENRKEVKFSKATHGKPKIEKKTFRSELDKEIDSIRSRLDQLNV